MDSQNLDLLLSSLKQYAWDFDINSNPTSLTCFAFSPEEARSRLLKFLTFVDESCASYRKLRNSHPVYVPGKKNEYNDACEVYSKALERVEKELPSFDKFDAYINTGCFTTGIHAYHLEMEVTFFDRPTSTHHTDTLQNIINKFEPRVSPFKLMNVISCLDG